MYWPGGDLRQGICDSENFRGSAGGFGEVTARQIEGGGALEGPRENNLPSGPAADVQGRPWQMRDRLPVHGPRNAILKPCLLRPPGRQAAEECWRTNDLQLRFVRHVGWFHGHRLPISVSGGRLHGCAALASRVGRADPLRAPCRAPSGERGCMPGAPRFRVCPRNSLGRAGACRPISFQRSRSDQRRCLPVPGQPKCRRCGNPRFNHCGVGPRSE